MQPITLLKIKLCVYSLDISSYVCLSWLIIKTLVDIYSSHDMYINICHGGGWPVLLGLLDGVDHVGVRLLPLVLHLVVPHAHVLVRLRVRPLQPLLLVVKCAAGILGVVSADFLRMKNIYTT